MQTDLDNLKDHMLSQLKLFSNGYANVYLDSTAEKFTTHDTRKTVSIQDNLGDYFYIRTVGDYKISESVKVISSMPKLQFQTDVVLVALMNNADPEILMRCLINVLMSFSKCEHPIVPYQALTTNEKIINTEFRFLSQEDKKRTLARLGQKKLVKVRFTMYENYQVNSCECNPCIDC